MNTADTGWCRPQEPRLSTDGSHEYLRSLAKSDKRVTHIAKKKWANKTEMVNAAVEQIREPCILLEVDSDELHSVANIEKIIQLFGNDSTLGAIKMRCRYFLGPDIVAVGKDCWSNREFEWLRCWRFKPGMRWARHEPPVLEGVTGRTMNQAESDWHRLSFDHLAYCTPQQIAFKEKFYGYEGLTNQWQALQNNTVWPVRLARFFPFVDSVVQADKL